MLFRWVHRAITIGGPPGRVVGTLWAQSPTSTTRRVPSGCHRTYHHLHVGRRKFSTANMDIPEGVLVGFGNPLLDITVVTDEAFLHKYNLEANNAILADDSHVPLFEELQHMNPEYMAGGATLNTIRVAQWLLQRPGATTFFGCIGNDHHAQILEEKSKSVGVHGSFQIYEKKPTGMCAAIITDENRSLVSELGAALHFTHHFLEHHVNQDLIKKGRVFYVCGFPFAVSPNSVKLIAEHSSAENKTLVMNLSAPYLCHFFTDPDINIMPHIDVLFGNETEAATFCKLAGIETTDIQQMALAVSKLPKKNSNRSRTVIFTQGRDPTIVAHEGQVSAHVIDPIDKSLIKDTNGCGDSFVAGFLAQLVQGKPLEECLRCGRYAAKVIIQYYGCTYPEKPDFK